MWGGISGSLLGFSELFFKTKLVSVGRVFKIVLPAQLCSVVLHLKSYFSMNIKCHFIFTLFVPHSATLFKAVVDNKLFLWTPLSRSYLQSTAKRKKN